MSLEDRVTRLERIVSHRPRRSEPWRMLVAMTLMLASIFAVYYVKRFMFPNTPTIYVILGVLPFTAVGIIIMMRRNKEHPPHCCSTCGYDLTGNVSGKCPECGTALSGGRN